MIIRDNHSGFDNKATASRLLKTAVRYVLSNEPAIYHSEKGFFAQRARMLAARREAKQIDKQVS